VAHAVIARIRSSAGPRTDGPAGAGRPRCIRRRGIRAQRVGRGLRSLAILAFLVLTPLAGLRTSCAAETEEIVAPERSVKAAFLYKFLAYIEWPGAAFPDPDAPIVVGTVGDDDIAAELADVVNGRLVDGRRVVIRKLADRSLLAGVHLLFVGSAARDRATQWLAEARRAGIPTVTEVPDGLERGSVINLLVIDGRVRFEVSLDAAEQAGIRISSRLLGVAYRVKGGRT
jgi:hypothetical protein